MTEEKSYPINFTFCARCGEQMKPHDASAELCGACYRPMADCLCKNEPSFTPTQNAESLINTFGIENPEVAHWIKSVATELERVQAECRRIGIACQDAEMNAAHANNERDQLKQKLAVARKALQTIARNECGNLYPGEVATDALFEAA